MNLKFWTWFKKKKLTYGEFVESVESLALQNDIDCAIMYRVSEEAGYCLAGHHKSKSLDVMKRAMEALTMLPSSKKGSRIIGL